MQRPKKTTYYNSERNTHLLLSTEDYEGLDLEGGIWMVGFLNFFDPCELWKLNYFFNSYNTISNAVLGNTRP